MKQFAIFAKYWQPGAVKTRLAKAIGPEAASELSRWFLALLIERFATMGDQRFLVYSPREARPSFRELADTSSAAWGLEPQCDGDLGVRLRTHFDRAFAAGAQDVVVIGSDSPTLPAKFIEGAWRALASGANVVLGPSADGGYYLVGARGTTPPIFDEIPWSTRDVFLRTQEAIQLAHLTCATLPAWYDVDEPADLCRLYDDLRQSAEFSTPASERLRAAVAPLVATDSDSRTETRTWKQRRY